MTNTKSGVSAKQLFLITALILLLITVMTALLTPVLVQKFYPLPADQGPAWYFWQLADTTTAARISYWLGFSLHLLISGIILLRTVFKNGHGGAGNRSQS